MVTRKPPIPRQRAPRAARAGFTLIEMLVVMTLIAILLTLAVPRFFGSLDHGRLTVQRQNLATIRDALDKFNADVGKYPDSLDDLVARRYLRALPIDPVTETAAWIVVAPPDPAMGNVYDVMPPSAVAGAASEPASGAAP